MEREKVPERKAGRLWFWIGVAAIVGILLGAGGAALTAPTPVPQRSFTVVAYHWGFAIYDEDGNEVPRIQVARGAEVTLLIVGAEALSHELHEAFEERVVTAWENNAEFGGKTAAELRELIHEAETQGLLNHSVFIMGYGIDVRTDVDTPAPQRVTFIADQVGTFDIQCNTFCGFGHGFMRLEGGLVVG